MAKIDVNQIVYRADETPYVKKFDGEQNVLIAIWEGFASPKGGWKKAPGFPSENLTIGDALREAYGTDGPNETRENKSKKGRLLQKLNKAIRKGVDFELSVDDAKLTLDEAARAHDTPVYIQIENAVEGRPAWDKEESIEETPLE